MFDFLMLIEPVWAALTRINPFRYAWNKQYRSDKDNELGKNAKLIYKLFLINIVIILFLVVFFLFLN